VRVRFAPSPMGKPHVGNIRTALFNWLFARASSGIFVLRVEDTDVARRVEGALKALMEDLLWLGLSYDEGTAGDARKELRLDFKERLGLSDRLVMFPIRATLTEV